MAAGDAEVVRGGFEALRDGGVEALLEFIHPDFETTTPAGLAAEPDTYRGHEGIRRWFNSFHEAMDDVRFDADEFVEESRRVVVPFVLRARGRTTGIEAAQRAVMVWEVEDGLARRVEVFRSLEEARASARGGAPPPPR